MINFQRSRDPWYVAICTVALLLVFTSCASFNKSSYNALGTMAVTYDTAMKSAADLHARGFISDEGKQEIVKAATAYSNAHNSAIDAFQDYLNAPPEQQAEKKQQFITVSRVLLSAYSELLNLLTSYGVYGEPVKPWF